MTILSGFIASNSTMGVATTLTSVAFTYTGAVQSWTVPANVTSIVATVAGASGGTGNSGSGGSGAVVTATIAVVPGSILKLVVGKVGSDGTSVYNNGGGGGPGAGASGLVYGGGNTSGENWGAESMDDPRNGSGSGGGLSGIFTSPSAVSSYGANGFSRIQTMGSQIEALVVAGGGGGGGYTGNGGNGGTPNGGSGGGSGPGGGATTSTVGTAGSNSAGGGNSPYPGVALWGGEGGTVNQSNASGGGGGGGGYYGGGGGGGGDAGGGGGGSSYVRRGSNISYGYNTGNGYISIIYDNMVRSNLVMYFNPANTASYSGTGTTLTNLTAVTGLNATLSTATFTSPYFTMNSTTSKIAIADNANIEPLSSNYSFEAWVYFASLKSQIVLAKTNSGGLSSNWGYGLRMANTSGTVTFEVGNGATSVTAPSFTASTGTWYQLTGVITFTPSKALYLYKNGIAVGTSTVHTFNSVNDTSPSLYLGNYNSGEYPAQTLNGRLGIVRFYKKALSATEVLQNFNTNKGLYGL